MPSRICHLQAAAPNIPLSLRGSRNPAHQPKMNRKQRKAMEARDRKSRSKAALH